MLATILIYIRTDESDFDRFAQAFFEALNVKHYQARESLHFGGAYYRFQLLGMDSLLFRNWDLDVGGPPVAELEDYFYSLQLNSDWDPVGLRSEDAENVLRPWLAQFLTLHLNVETATPSDPSVPENGDVLFFRKNPFYKPSQGMPAVLMERRVIS